MLVSSYLLPVWVEIQKIFIPGWDDIRNQQSGIKSSDTRKNPRQIEHSFLYVFKTAYLLSIVLVYMRVLTFWIINSHQKFIKLCRFYSILLILSLLLHIWPLTLLHFKYISCSLFPYLRYPFDQNWLIWSMGVSKVHFKCTLHTLRAFKFLN